MLLECRGLDFSLRGPGFNAVVFGPSGGGKTSLARIAAGEIPRYS